MKLFNWFVLVLMFFSFHPMIFAQKEKEVKVKINNETLYGSLINVQNKSKAPVVIIIPGSGPTDRNGNSMLVQANSYRLLAEELAKEGIASLRYDKLMVGKSKSNLKEADFQFQNNVEQINAWIDYLKKKKYNTIILVGHSEGSLVGMLAAQQKEVSKFISIAGAGRSANQILIEQISAQSPQYTEEVETILSQLKQGHQVEKFSPELAGLFRLSVQPYMISWLKYNPQSEIGKLKIPIMILHGSTDLQVTEEDALLQKKGNPQAKLVIIEGMNHVLKETTENKNENMKTYYNPQLPLHPELIKNMVSFIQSNK